MGLITYVSLLLLTPNILSLRFDPQDNAFLFPSWTSPLQGKDLDLQVCEYLRQQSHEICGHNMTFNFDYTLSRFNDYFATHKASRSRSNGFLPDVYQIWDGVMWLTPEEGRLISTAPICWEQTEPSPKVSQQLNYNDWKQLGFLPQEICNVIIPMFSNPSSGAPFVWPGTNWDWISQSRWLAPNGTYWVCGSSLWAWLPPAFTLGFIFSELPEKPANLPHLKIRWARSVFHWYDYLAAVFVPSLGTTDAMLRVDALTNFTQQALQDSQKAISALNAEQAQIRKVILQNRLALDILTAAQGGTCAVIHTQCCPYIPDRSTHVTHFTKHTNKMIGAMATPEASTASTWETLTSSPWRTTILITIILIVLFLLFARCICNCITGFVSSCMKAFKLQMVAQTPATAAASSNYYLGPLDQISST
ncbi:hypothetical protein K5549_011796 [Capra hircus]|nr:hypothetical protein K5549_011796 [Capra hircus]